MKIIQQIAQVRIVLSCSPYPLPQILAENPHDRRTKACHLVCCDLAVRTKTYRDDGIGQAESGKAVFRRSGGSEAGFILERIDKKWPMDGANSQSKYVRA
ncbi:MAG: hypothetical protein WAN12_16985 [Candidatus Acidiferrum sp.]